MTSLLIDGALGQLTGDLIPFNQAAADVNELWALVAQASSLGPNFSSAYNNLSGGRNILSDVAALVGVNPSSATTNAAFIATVLTDAKAAIAAVQDAVNPPSHLPYSCAKGAVVSCNAATVNGWSTAAAALQDKIDGLVCQLEDLKSQKDILDQNIASCALKLEETNPTPTCSAPTSAATSCGCSMKKKSKAKPKKKKTMSKKKPPILEEDLYFDPYGYYGY